jgi:hypothetical protein
MSLYFWIQNVFPERSVMLKQRSCYHTIVLRTGKRHCSCETDFVLQNSINMYTYISLHHMKNSVFICFIKSLWRVCTWNPDSTCVYTRWITWTHKRGGHILSVNLSLDLNISSQNKLYTKPTVLHQAVVQNRGLLQQRWTLLYRLCVACPVCLKQFISLTPFKVDNYHSMEAMDYFKFSGQ